MKLADATAAPGSAGKSLLVRLANTVSADDAGKVRDLLVKKLDGQPLFAELTTFQSSVAGDTRSPRSGPADCHGGDYDLSVVPV